MDDLKLQGIHFLFSGGEERQPNLRAMGPWIRSMTEGIFRLSVGDRGKPQEDDEHCISEVLPHRCCD